MGYPYTALLDAAPQIAFSMVLPLVGIAGVVRLLNWIKPKAGHPAGLD